MEFKYNSEGKFILSKKLFLSKLAKKVMDYSRLPFKVHSGRQISLGEETTVIILEKIKEELAFDSLQTGYEKIRIQQSPGTFLESIIVSVDEVFDKYSPGSFIHAENFLTGVCKFPVMVLNEEWNEAGFRIFYELID